MSYTNGLDKPTDFFITKLYNGTGSSNAITDVGFRPDFTWIKRRNSATAHHLHNSISGATKVLNSNTSNAESTDAQKLSSFDSDGFTVGTNGDANNSSGTFVSWNWLASNSTTSNSDGDITSTVSANTTSGFSIVKYTGNGSASNIGHGLGVAPKCIIIKNLSSTADWLVGHEGLHPTLGWKYGINLNSTGARHESGTYFADTPPTTSVFKVEANAEVNTSGDEYIAYCFADTGNKFFKAGSYIGNGNNDGPMIFCGFKPAFVIIKPSSYSNSWLLLDNKRPGYNVTNQRFEADGNGAEYSGLDYADFLSNGFKIRTSNSHPNNSGGTLIYMAFAENPFVTSTGIPTTAR